MDDETRKLPKNSQNKKKPCALFCTIHVKKLKKNSSKIRKKVLCAKQKSKKKKEEKHTKTSNRRSLLQTKQKNKRNANSDLFRDVRRAVQVNREEKIRKNYR